MNKASNAVPNYDPDWQALIGYVKAVSAAAICFGVQCGIMGWLGGSASSVPMPERLWQMLTMVAILMIVFAFCVAITAWLPFWLAIATARRLRVTSAASYVACALITAAILSPLLLLVPDGLDAYDNS